MDKLQVNPKGKGELTKLIPLCTQFPTFQKLQIVTLSDAVSNKGSTIRTLNKYYEESDVKGFIVLQIGFLSKQFNVGKTLDGPQILTIADLIIQRKSHLKFADLKLCFDNMVTGVYGKMFDRIDASIIFECIEKYEIEKSDFLTQEYENKKHDQNGIIHPDVWSKIKLEPEKKKPEIKRPVSEAAKITQGIIREFDAIWMKYPVRYEGLPISPRMIEHVGKKMSCEDYLNARMAEINDVQDDNDA